MSSHHGWVNGQPPTSPGRDYESKRVQREQAELIARRERQDAVRKQQDAAYDAEQRAKRAAAEAARSRRLASAAAAVRARVERELRLSGCPEGQVRARADAAMARYFEDLATEAAQQGDRQWRELKEYFASRGI